MSDVKLSLSEEHAGKSKEEVSKILDGEVDRFSNWMATVGPLIGGPLIPQERTLLKTYLYQKLKGVLDGTSTG